MIAFYTEISTSGSNMYVTIRRNDNYECCGLTPQFDPGKFIPASAQKLFSRGVQSVTLYGLNGKLITKAGTSLALSRKTLANGVYIAVKQYAGDRRERTRLVVKQ